MSDFKHIAAGTAFLLTACGQEGVDVDPTFSSIKANIIEDECARCHLPGGANFNGRDFSTRDSLVTGGYVLPGDSASSPLYIQTSTGTMPKDGSMLSADEIGAIKEWIDAGAPND